jgi:hypothetical protein
MGWKGGERNLSFLGVIISLHYLGRIYITKSFTYQFWLNAKGHHTFIPYVLPKFVMREPTKVAMSITFLYPICFAKTCHEKTYKYDQKEGL